MDVGPRSVVGAATFVQLIGKGGLSRSSFGGKGAGLEALVGGGFPVPPALCITVEAFQEHLRRALLTHPERPPAEAFRATPLCAALVDAINDSVLDLSAHDLRARTWPRAFAVRSSSEHEDGKAHSFAGLYSSRLDVTEPLIAEAVKECWMSQWSGAAIAYRKRFKIKKTSAMAVIVQQQVPSELSAFLFTENPVSSKQNEIVVNIVRGGGDALASGVATPYTAVIERETVSNGQHPATEKWLFRAGDIPCAPETITDLVHIALAVEVCLGGPLDVEAAFADGLWHLLQARPITAR